VPVCTGRELTDNLLEQIKPFGAIFHYGQEVAVIEKQTDGRFFVETSKGTRLLTKTIFIAAGVGAFQPRTLKIDGLETFEDSQLFYRVRNPADFAGKNLVIVGGGDSALDWALDFVKDSAHKAESVILVHRRDGFKAAPANVARMKELCDAMQMQFMIGQVTGYEDKDNVLTGIKVTGADGVTRLVPLDVLLVFFGLSPKLGPIAEWGLDIERKQLKVDTEKFSTNEPGIFAVGDINTYPGKKKLILSGFHECALAAFGAMPIISPDKKVFLQYTTTSPKLHKVLGVESPVFD
jgi:thioredoxin reductase (NADPH)